MPKVTRVNGQPVAEPFATIHVAARRAENRARRQQLLRSQMGLTS